MINMIMVQDKVWAYRLSEEPQLVLRTYEFVSPTNDRFTVPVSMVHIFCWDARNTPNYQQGWSLGASLKVTASEGTIRSFIENKLIPERQARENGYKYSPWIGLRAQGQAERSEGYARVATNSDAFCISVETNLITSRILAANKDEIIHNFSIPVLEVGQLDESNSLKASLNTLDEMRKEHQG